MTDNLYSEATLAVAFSIPEADIKSLYEEHGLKHSRLPNGEVRFAGDDVEEFLHAHREPRPKGEGCQHPDCLAPFDRSQVDN